jgi:hypothetical protein
VFFSHFLLVGVQVYGPGIGMPNAVIYRAFHSRKSIEWLYAVRTAEFGQVVVDFHPVGT